MEEEVRGRGIPLLQDLELHGMGVDCEVGDEVSSRSGSGPQGVASRAATMRLSGGKNALAQGSPLCEARSGGDRKETGSRPASPGLAASKEVRASASFGSSAGVGVEKAAGGRLESVNEVKLRPQSKGGGKTPPKPPLSPAAFDGVENLEDMQQFVTSFMDTADVEPLHYATETGTRNCSRTKKEMFYSQPLTPPGDRKHRMRRALTGYSEPVTPRGRMRSPLAGDSTKASNYKIFRTGSNKNFERAPLSRSGVAGGVNGPLDSCQNRAKLDPMDEDVVVAQVSAGRYFDALKGPEFEIVKDSEELLLPLDQKWPFLLRFPVGSFGITLGLGSQSMLWKTLATSESTRFLHIPDAINMVLWWLALAALLVIFCIYVCKCIYYFEAVRREYYHPVRINYFFAPWIACMFLTIGVPPRFATKIHPVFWCLFMAPILALELKIYGQWLSGGDRRLSKVANPSTHLSVVGNFVGSLLGALAGWKEAAIFFWAVGLAHYLVVFVTLYQRLPTNEALPKELHPVFFLFVAAPSAASVAWMRINGDFDNVSRIVYFVSLFLYTVLVVRVNFFRGIRFSLAWWSYSFPMTSASIATVQYSRFVTHPITQSMAVLLSAISSTTVLVLFLSTLLHAFLWDGLFPNDLAIAITSIKRKNKKKGSSRERYCSNDDGAQNGSSSCPQPHLSDNHMKDDGVHTNNPFITAKAV